MPATVVGSYQDYEREAVTWPRRGWIRAEIIERLAHLGFLDKFAALEAAAYVERVDERFRLTEAGREHVPAVIDFLLPETQRALYQRDFDANRHNEDIFHGWNDVFHGITPPYSGLPPEIVAPKRLREKRV